MALEIQQKEREGVTILDMKGRITVGKEATALREKCAEVAAAGHVNVVFNLQNVDFIDSTGLGRWSYVPPVRARTAGTSNC